MPNYNALANNWTLTNDHTLAYNRTIYNALSYDYRLAMHGPVATVGIKSVARLSVCLGGTKYA